MESCVVFLAIGLYPGFRYPTLLLCLYVVGSRARRPIGPRYVPLFTSLDQTLH